MHHGILLVTLWHSTYQKASYNSNQQFWPLKLVVKGGAAKVANQSQLGSEVKKKGRKERIDGEELCIVCFHI